MNLPTAILLYNLNLPANYPRYELRNKQTALFDTNKSCALEIRARREAHRTRNSFSCKPRNT